VPPTALIARGTEGSNPFRSSSESSANRTSLCSSGDNFAARESSALRSAPRQPKFGQAPCPARNAAGYRSGTQHRQAEDHWHDEEWFGINAVAVDDRSPQPPDPNRPDKLMPAAPMTICRAEGRVGGRRKKLDAAKRREIVPACRSPVDGCMGAGAASRRPPLMR